VGRYHGDEVGGGADDLVVRNLSHGVIELGMLRHAPFDLFHRNVVFLKHLFDLLTRFYSGGTQVKPDHNVGRFAVGC